MEKQKVEYNFVKASAKEAPFSNGGERIRISILLDDLVRLVEQNPDIHVKGYVNVELIKKKAVDQYGNSHMLIESTFKPSAKIGQAKKDDKVVIEDAVAPKQPKPQTKLESDTTDDLPF